MKEYELLILCLKNMGAMYESATAIYKSSTAKYTGNIMEQIGQYLRDELLPVKKVLREYNYMYSPNSYSDLWYVKWHNSDSYDEISVRFTTNPQKSWMDMIIKGDGKYSCWFNDGNSHEIDSEILLPEIAMSWKGFKAGLHEDIGKKLDKQAQQYKAKVSRMAERTKILDEFEV